MTDEQQAIAAALTDLLLQDIRREYDQHGIIWQAMDALKIEDTDEAFARLYALLTSGKWRVIYEDTP